MKKQILTIILGIFLIGTISAIYSGECVNVTFPNVDDVEFNVIGNSSNMEGFNWTKNGTLIQYCFVLNFKPDNFTLEWYNYESIVIEEKEEESNMGIHPSMITRVYSIPEGKLIEGYQRRLYLKYTMTFTTNLEHTLNVEKIENGTVRLRIQSDPIYLELTAGESKKVDLDGSLCVYDLLVEAKSISKLYADIKITQIQEHNEECDSIYNDSEDLDESDKETKELLIPEGEEEEEGKYTLKEIIIISIILIIFIALCLIVYFSIKENPNKKKEDKNDRNE